MIKLNLKKKWLFVFIPLLVLGVLMTVPIKTATIGECDNVPRSIRLSALRGDSIEEESKRLGGMNACPSVILTLFIF